MASIRIQKFAGLLPEVAPKLLREDHAQVAHNALLWNGYLRPMPAWTSLGTNGAPVASLFPNPNNLYPFDTDTVLTDAVVNYQEPFNRAVTFGINAGKLNYRNGVNTGTVYSLLPVAYGAATSQTITNMNLSVYPIPRTYAVTVMSGNMESAPFVFPQIGGMGGLFEGDIVTLNWFINIGSGNNPTGLRLYRTIPGFDTSEQVGNPIETGFHLVHEFTSYPVGGTFAYTDAADSSKIPGDLLLTEQFNVPLCNNLSFLGATETGWLVSGGIGPEQYKSKFQVSERFLWHAWPLQNYVEISEQFTDAVTFYDEVFIGTTARPYHMRITFSDNVEIDSLDIAVRPFPDYYACVPGTMVTTNSGAMYASPDGLVSLEVNESAIATRQLTNPGDTLRNPVVPIKVSSATQAAWWNGFYAGFCNGVGYLFNIENNHNNQFPLGQLITFDTPSGIAGPNLVVPSTSVGAFNPSNPGLLSTWGNLVYSWPMPGYGYEAAQKLTYTWRSKVFTMPGITTMAAAKVVHDASQQVMFNLYGDGVLLYSIFPNSSEPFRLPHQHRCTQFEIELIGTSEVQEVQVSTSMRDLTEEQGHD